MIIQRCKDILDWQFEPMWNKAETWYHFNEEAKFYHNYEHAFNVVSKLFALTEVPSKELIIAALWHDAVYIPGAWGDANELASAAAMEYTAKTLGLQRNEVIVGASQLIYNTRLTVHTNPIRIAGELAMLLDADLSSLADGFPAFLQTQANIIAENGGTVEEHSKQSADFLKQFLTCRKSIYHTAFARGLWEDKARSNIEQYWKLAYA